MENALFTFAVEKFDVSELPDCARSVQVLKPIERLSITTQRQFAIDESSGASSHSAVVHSAKV